MNLLNQSIRKNGTNMSEFTCSNFCEPVSSSESSCPVCGKPITHMDGFTSKQWDIIEEDTDREALENEERDNSY